MAATPRSSQWVTPPITLTSRKINATAKLRVIQTRCCCIFALADEDESQSGGKHQQHGIYCRGNGEGAGKSQAFVQVLNVSTEWRCNHGSCEVHPPNHAMEPDVAPTKPIGKLHRAEQDRAGSGKPVGEQPPLERLTVLPDRVFSVDEETFVMDDYVSQHQSDRDKQKELRPNPGRRLR
jgi:hypothetical protein